MDWTEEEAFPSPKGKLRWAQKPDSSFEIVPVVYVTNRTLLKADGQVLDSLSVKMADLIKRKLDEGGLPMPKEIQIDCDWTGRTKQRYSALLTKLQIHFPADMTW